MPRATPPAHTSYSGEAGRPAVRWLLLASASVLALFVSCRAVEAAGPGAARNAAALIADRPVPHGLWSLPFGALLLAIAVLPMVPVARHWWERNGCKLALSLALGGVVLAHYATRGYGCHGAAPGVATVRLVLEHALVRDYVPFMVLLGSLYVISGGVQLRGELRALPSVNTGLLAVGALAASLVGTTGASMVLIRPLLQINRDREHVRHTVVFFIFLVSNIGGCLLPTGDPPLFLGYLHGVPFFWTLRLAAPWFFSVAVLLAVYYVWDTLAIRRETRDPTAADVRHVPRLQVHGSINLLWLLGVVLAAALIVPGRPLPGTGLVVAVHAREALIIALVGLSLATTPRGLRKETEYSNAAVLEVACLFVGIFLTVQAPIEILQARGSALGLTTPLQFFWATGALSGFLDNAPTYLVFFETAKTLPVPRGAALLTLLDGSVRHDLLASISLGAVFMGANTYIGNAPNLMVKLIAEQRRVSMPGFFGYMLYSGAVLFPLFCLVSILFFR